MEKIGDKIQIVQSFINGKPQPVAYNHPDLPDVLLSPKYLMTPVDIEEKVLENK
jgi:hypothetical protein